jgi:hypothetical protein
MKGGGTGGGGCGDKRAGLFGIARKIIKCSGFSWSLNGRIAARRF